MTNLNCSVSNCAHYNANKCCAGNIKVDGQNAHDSECTCCDTFVEKSGNFTNSCTSPAPSIEISCKAENCVYNTGMKCTADHVNIGGAGACDCSATKCATFQER